MTATATEATLTRVFHASCGRLYAAWTDPLVLRRWLAPGPLVVERVETDLRVGGAFRLETLGPAGARHRITGRYLALEPGRRVVQSWIYDGPLDLLPGVETELEITLTPIDARTTELALVHRRLTRADVCDAYRADWPTCLDKLETTLGD